MTREEVERMREGWERYMHEPRFTASAARAYGERTKRPLHYRSRIIYGHWEQIAQYLFSLRGEPVVANVLEIRHRN